MENLLPYEALNEAAAALPAMPAFLKTAGAKPQYVQYGGPRNMGDKPANAWVLEIPSTNGKKTWRIDFMPNGTFNTTATGAEGASFLKSAGKWKANPSGTFKMGNKTIKGVDMTFTAFLVMNPPA